MSSQQLPLVSVVTPLYNNEDHLADCIESVLAQTYPNWDYTIVNNCSTDRSLEIANRYAGRHPRIRVFNNTQFLPVLANHNNALRQISSGCKYAKMVFADDWIFPRCIEEMVALAEQNPSVGVVQGYTMWATSGQPPYSYILKGSGFSYPSPCLAGHEVGRRAFLEGLDLVGAATSLLYRADFVKRCSQFFNEANFHGDREAFIEILKQSDLGFIHQVLTFNRARPNSLNHIAREMHLDIGCMLQILVNHGRDFLSGEEFEFCLRRQARDYYNFLAVSIMRGRRNKEFWRFHVKKLDETVGFRRRRLAGAIILRVWKALLHPWQTASKAIQELKMTRNSPLRLRVDTAALTANATELQ